MIDIESKRILVVGAGASGLAATRLLVSRGATVCLVDEFEPRLSPATRAELEWLGVGLHFSVTSLEFGEWDLAIVSPGVSPDSMLGSELQRVACPVMGEVELASQLYTGKVVAITGTNGKTTTTRLVDSVMRDLGWRSKAAGNIGFPFAQLVSKAPVPDWVALELSSFQLESVNHFHPETAVLLNLAPDHLDRYQSEERYYRSKARIFEQQDCSDWAVVQFEALAQLASLGIRPKAQVLTFSSQDTRADLYYARGYIVSQIPGWSGIVYDMRQGLLSGSHNAENVMAALLVSYTLGMPLSDVQISMMNFRADAHRFEVLPTESGVVFVNDSKATNPASMRAAIEASKEMREPKGRLWLLAGGVSKGLSFQGLESLIHEHVDGLFLFGESRDEMSAVLGGGKLCFVNETLRESLDCIFQRIEKGDLVLFSPGCASFDQFRDYQDRGNTFKQTVKELLAVKNQSLGRRHHARFNVERDATRSENLQFA